MNKMLNVFRMLAQSLLLFVAFSFAMTAQANEEAETLVKSVSDKVLQILNDNKETYLSDPDSLFSLIETEVMPFIDFSTMAKLTLIKHWKAATEEQRTQFSEAYKNMLIRTYTESFDKYTGARLEVLGSDARREGYVSVKCEVLPGNLPVEYDLRQVDGTWKAYDMTFEGVSMIKNYRNSFDREIEQSGLEALIQRLQNGDDVTEVKS